MEIVERYVNAKREPRVPGNLAKTMGRWRGPKFMKLLEHFNSAGRAAM